MTINADQTESILASLTVPLLVSRVKDGTLLYVNDQLSHLIGTDKEELIGKQTPDFYYNPADRLEVLQLIQEKGGLDEKELPIKTLDGTVLWVMISSRLLQYEDDMAIISTLVDITDRKKAEQLLIKRAAEMETVSQVSAFATSILEIDKLLQEMVDLTKVRFGLYHTHIYLLDNTGDLLNLTAGAGDVGRQMVAQKRTISLVQEQSLVAQAGRSQQGVIENDVRQNPAFLPNSLLPDTRAEMAVPMMVGDRLIGVLDVQANQANYFTQESIHVYTTLAAQIAVAYQNARSFHLAQQSLTETKVLLDITQETSRFLDLPSMLDTILDQVLLTTRFESGLITIFNSQDDALQLRSHRLPDHFVQSIEADGLDGSLCDLVFRRQEPIVVTDLAKGAPVNVTGLVDMGYQSYQGVPLEAAGEVLGTLCIFCTERRTEKEANTPFLQAVGQQIGNAIRNAMLFEQAQAALEEAKRTEEVLVRQTEELNALARRLTREGWEDYLLTVSQEEMGFVFDGELVHQAQESFEMADFENPFVQSIEIHGVPIGKLAVVSEEADSEIEEVIESVLRQLEAHIENLRLTEQTQIALAQTESLYTGSELIVLSTTEEDILRALIHSTELRRLDRANLFMFDHPVEDGVPGNVTAVAVWENENVAHMMEVGMRFLVEQVPFLGLLKPNATMVINDIRHDERVDATTRQIMESFGMNSFVLFPMVVGSQWLGIVAGQSAKPLNINEIQLRQANSLVSQAAVVMQTTILFRQEQARARREQLLREIATKVRSSTDVDTIMRTAVTEIGRTLGRRAFITLGSNLPGQGHEGNGAT